VSACDCSSVQAAGHHRRYAFAACTSNDLPATLPYRMRDQRVIAIAAFSISTSEGILEIARSVKRVDGTSERRRQPALHS